MMTGAYPGNPRLMYSIVDVRDVAVAHLAAMRNPIATGNHYLCTSETLWFREMSQILSQHFGSRGYKVSTRQLPNIFTHFRAIWQI